MGTLGFKDITLENWLQPDETLRYFKKSRPNGQLDIVSGDGYLEAALTPTLLKAVPENIQALFEVARGAVAYGYFFYPLYALAGEQLFRVAEAALKQRCKHLQVPRSKKTFQDRINWLAESGIISDAEAARWQNIRHLRNKASHPTGQMISTPMDALGILATAAEEINSLFAGDCSRGG